ncbi:MAG: hypothetical protein ACQEQT_01605 [Chloroflexota bacterium]
MVFLVLLFFSPPLAALTPPTVRVQESSSTENVEFVGHIGGGVCTVAVRGGYSYVADDNAGFFILRYTVKRLFLPLIQR